jgi:hypothetical protein
MPPLRRYLRVTRNSVLEVRIHLDHPSNTSWLLEGGNPALPRIISAVRPLVLPKLREEFERSGSKAATRKGQVKDVITEGASGDRARRGRANCWAGDFEVVMFLVDTPTRHSVLRMRRVFSKPVGKQGLAGWLEKPPEGEQPVDVDMDSNSPPPIIRQESPDEDLAEDADEKLTPHVEYDGFSIHGRALCLVVKRKTSASGAGYSQQMMENWMSTQVVRGES